jgi:uncharacterized Zn finger protein
MSLKNEDIVNESENQKKYYMVKKENYYKEVKCEACGLVFKQYNKSHHLKSKKHQLIVQQKEIESIKKELETFKNNAQK